MPNETAKPVETAIGSVVAATDAKVEAKTTEVKTEAKTDAKVETKADAKPAETVDPKVAEKAAADKAAAEADALPFTDVAQLKLADGQKLEESVAKDFLATAKDLGLSAKQARGLYEFNAKLASAAETQRAEKLAAAGKAAADALRNDKDIGGANFEKSMALAGKAIRNVLGVEFGKWATSLELADGTMLGDRVEFARALVELGKTISEDSKAGSQSNGAPKGKSLTELMYGPGTVVAGPVS